MDVPTYTATQKLTDTGQKTVDQQQLAQYGLAQLANTQTGRVADTLGSKLSFDGLPSMVSGLDTSKITQVPTGIDNSGMTSMPTGADLSRVDALPTGIDTRFATNGVPKGINTSALGMLSTGVNTAGLPSQTSSLNTGSLSAMPTDPTQMNKTVSDAMYNQATSRLDPQWTQQEQLLRDRLTQQGIPEGSEAWTTEMGNFSRAKNDAYTSAQNAATVSGAQIGGTDYGLALQGRQQGVTEQTTSADLARQAATLGLSEQQLDAAIKSGTVGQIIGAQTANAGVANQAAQTGVAAQTANAGVANQAAQTGLAGQQLNGSLAAAYNQFLLQDQAQNAQIAQGAAAQQTQQQMLSAQLAQAARQQGVSEQQYLYNLPLNQTSALLSGSQVQGPQFVNTPQTNIQAPNVTGAYALQNQAQQQTYQNQVQAQSASMGGLFGLASAGLMAGLMPGAGAAGFLMGSSRDIKENMQPLNRLEVLNGVNNLVVERWKYKHGVADSAEHVGAYAEEYAKEFGGDGKTIDLISMVGVLTISIQALTDKIGSLQDRIIELESAK